MIDGTYDLLIGDKRGEAVLTTAQGTLNADVKIKGFPRQKGTGTYDGNSFTAEGGIKIPLVGAIEYRLEGTVQDDLLDAKCVTSKGTLHVSGIRRS